MRPGAGTTRNIIVAAAMAAACLSLSGQAYRVRPLNVRPRPLEVNNGAITLSASPSMISFALVPGGRAQGSSGISITASWDVKGNHTTLNVYGYFNSANAALTNGSAPSNVIPSSAVLGQVSTGIPTSYAAFTQTTPFNGADSGLLLVTDSEQHPTTGSRTDVLNLVIDLSAMPSPPAGTYTGTLTLQATMN